MTATILPFPALHTVRLVHLDGRPFARASFVPNGCSDAWAWIVETVAHELGCFPEDVHCLEGDEGDVITADGIPCYMCRL